MIEINHMNKFYHVMFFKYMSAILKINLMKTSAVNSIKHIHILKSILFQLV